MLRDASQRSRAVDASVLASRCDAPQHEGTETPRIAAKRVEAHVTFCCAAPQHQDRRGRGVWRNEAKRATLRPRPPRRAKNQPAGVANDRRLGSIVSGLLFTMNGATRTCEPSAQGASLGRIRDGVGLRAEQRHGATEKAADAPTQPAHRAAESSGCGRVLFSSCYLLLFEGNERRQTGARSGPFPVRFLYVTGKSTGAGLYPRSCFLLLFTGTTVIAARAVASRLILRRRRQPRLEGRAAPCLSCFETPRHSGWKMRVNA
jgi:hypothetical protein